MRYIDMENWSRRSHFDLFSGFDHPHFSMCANVDLTAFRPYAKQRGLSFNIAFVYVLARAANAIPEFRQRIRDGQVVEHATVHPSTTILTDDELFTFCHITYDEDFTIFALGADEAIARVKQTPTLEDGPGQDDLLFMTAIPWVTFTSFTHPIHLNPADSVPRFAWGKFFEEGDAVNIPLSVQGHHALMDGLHMGRYYQQVEHFLSHPGKVLG